MNDGEKVFLESDFQANWIRIDKKDLKTDGKNTITLYTGDESGILDENKSRTDAGTDCCDYTVTVARLALVLPDGRVICKDTWGALKQEGAPFTITTYTPVDVAGGSTLYQPHLATYAGVTVTENEIVNSSYYTDGADSTLIERQGIRKTTSKINPPKNVVRTYDEATNSVTLTWNAPDAQSDQTVKKYVVYDENNAYEKDWTSFTTDTTITIPMGDAKYTDTDFVVKSIGIHSVSDAGSN